MSPELPSVPPRQGPLRSAALTCGDERWLPVTCPRSVSIGVDLTSPTFTIGATPMDLSIYAQDFTQHVLFGRVPGAPCALSLPDTFGHVYLVTIGTNGG